MKQYVLIFLLGMASVFSAFAQQPEGASFYINIQYDTVGLNDQMQVSYVLENVQALEQLPNPHFEGFQVVFGPSTSQSMSIINGHQTQSMSYTYVLKPLDLGYYILPSVTLETEQGWLTANERTVVVVEEAPRRAMPQDPFNNAFQDPFFQQSPFSHEEFFQQRSNPYQRMDEMMKQMDEMMRQQPPSFYYQMPPVDPQDPRLQPQPKKKPKKKEKTYKI